MKIVKLTDTDFILEYEDPDGLQLKMHMIACNSDVSPY